MHTNATTAPATERVVGPLSEADVQALATMNERLKAYVELHTKLERSLPKLPNQATPEQIDKNQRTFEQLMREARTSAKAGDIFTPEITRCPSRSTGSTGSSRPRAIRYGAGAEIRGLTSPPAGFMRTSRATC
jgi:hypothetical protein